MSIYNTKTKRTRQRKSPLKLSENSTIICDYGCGNEAIYKFTNGKYCCSNQAGNCSFIRKQAGNKQSKTKKNIQENGKTIAENAAAKIAANKRKNIDDSGLDMHFRSSKAVAERKRHNIDENGLNTHQRNGLKYKKWCNSKEGKLYRQNRSKKQQKVMNTVVNDTGLTEAQRRSSKMVITKLTNIDENGLNGFERSSWKNKNSGHVNGIYYQSSNEKRFLEFLKETNEIEYVYRGTSIDYCQDNKRKRYLPDYIIGNELYEVKSSYTMYGPNNKFLTTNILKLEAAEKEGYVVYLVIDDIIIPYEKFKQSL